MRSEETGIVGSDYRVRLRVSTVLLLAIASATCYNIPSESHQARIGVRAGEMVNKYREKLPQGCPPLDAEEIKSTRCFFRLTEGNPAKDSDFLSQRAIAPKAIFNCDECVASDGIGHSQMVC